MAEKVKELDTKLRERGTKKLTQELDALFSPIYARLGGSNFALDHTAPGSTHEAPETALDALNAVRRALEEQLRPTYEQQEIDAFVDRVDGLKSQIDELVELRT